jgi:hypothetical protein
VSKVRCLETLFVGVVKLFERALLDLLALRLKNIVSSSRGRCLLIDEAKTNRRTLPVASSVTPLRSGRPHEGRETPPGDAYGRRER